MNDKLKPALISGGAIGLLIVVTTLISTYVSPFGCCNCLWPIGAGLLAVFLHVKNSPTPVQIGDGAILGAIAGAVAGLLYFIIGVPVSYLINSAAMQQQFQQLGIGSAISGLVLTVVFGFIGAVIITIISTIGGLLGTVLFEKRKGDTGGTAPPPPPSNFGGTPPPPSGFGGNQPGGFGGGNQPGGSGGFGSNQPGGFGSGNQPGGGGGMGGNQPGGFGR